MKLQVCLAWFWLLVFTNAVAPKNFLHAFHAHEETCDNVTANESISSQHEHCSFLKLQLFAYVGPNNFVEFHQAVLGHYDIVVPTSGYTYNGIYYRLLRGPPVC
jgi:hypothetical protein